MEFGLKVERTKVGAGQKREAIVIEAQKAKGYAVFVLCAMAMIGLVAADYKFELVSLAVRNRALFKLKEINRMAEHAAQARLMRLGAALESHLERDHRQMEQLNILTQRQAKLIKQHDAEVKKLVNLGLSPDALGTKLQTSAKEFNHELRHLLTRHTKYIIAEGSVADNQLSSLHKEIMQELQTEVMEDSYNRDPKSMADTKALQEASASQIEGLKLMLHNFEHKVRAIEQVALSKKKFAQWEKLLADTKAGAVDFDEAETTMLKLMNEAKIGPLTKRQEDKNSVLEQFEAMLMEVKFSPVKRQILEQLRRWESGQVSVQSVLLNIQKMVKRGEIDPDWFNGEQGDTPQTQRERDNADHNYVGAHVAGMLETMDRNPHIKPPNHDT